MIEEDKGLNSSEEIKNQIDEKLKVIDDLKNHVEIFEQERILLLQDQ